MSIGKSRRQLAVQIIFALFSFALPLLFYPVQEKASENGLWQKLDFEKSQVTHLGIGGQGENVIRYAVVAGRGVFRNTDDPAYWAFKSTGLPKDLFGRISIRDLAVSPQDPRLVYAAAASGPNQGGVYETLNGGASWQLADRQLTGPAGALAITSGPNPVTFAAVAGRLYQRTENQGWQLVQRWEGKTIICIETSLQQDQELYVGTAQDGLFYSTDGGKTWQAIHEPLRGHTIQTIVAATTTTEQTAYIGTDVGLFKLTLSAGGASSLVQIWSDRNVHALLNDPERSEHLYAGTARNGLYDISDGGKRWSPIKKVPGDSTFYALALDPMQPNHLYAGTSNGLWHYAMPARPSEAATVVPATASPTSTRTSTDIARPTLTSTSTEQAMTATSSPTQTSAAGTQTATRTKSVTTTPTVSASPTHTATATLTVTPLPPTATWTATAISTATLTPRPPTHTLVPATDTPAPPPTNTPRPTNTSAPPPPTPVPPTATLPKRNAIQ